MRRVVDWLAKRPKDEASYVCCSAISTNGYCRLARRKMEINRGRVSAIALRDILLRASRASSKE